MNRESEYLAAIIENAGSLIVVLDCHGRIQRFNRACERATGYMFEEVRGQPFFDLFLISEEIGPVKEVFERLLAKDFPNHFENHWKTKAGRVRMISWNNTALLDGQGDVEHIVSIGIDVTEQRAAEKALRGKRRALPQPVLPPPYTPAAYRPGYRPDCRCQPGCLRLLRIYPGRTQIKIYL